MEAIARTRCANHETREAAARCPRCGRCFCRECVTEHEGEFVCAECLATRRRDAGAGRRLFAAFRPAAGLALGILLAWLFFALAGKLLLAIPASFHEGTLWDTAASAR